MAESDDLARNVVAGIFGPREKEWLQKGFATRQAARGSIPLERYLGLHSTTAARMARDERDVHLISAWQLANGETPWGKSVLLAGEVKAFLARIWPIWRREPSPPSGASELRRHLFLAVRAADHAGIGVPETARQIHNIARDLAK